MPRPECDGDVTTLNGHYVLLTGKTRVEGEHWLRTKLVQAVRSRGANVLEGSRNRAITLLVVGELHPDIVTDPIHNRSQNLVFAERQRSVGNHICIVDDFGISALLRGESAPCLRTHLVDSGTVEVSAPKPKRTRLTTLTVAKAPIHESTDLNLDLAGLDRATAAHQNTLRLLIDHLAPTTVQSLSAPRVDGAWLDPSLPSRLFIAEIKSLQGTREDQQVRLGIGQLLDYAHEVRTRPPEGVDEVIPVLVLERGPTDARWRSLVATLGIRLVWAPTFAGLLQPEAWS